ncbi:unnamed protein product [Kuraishia capsulata CBS 1993]|uniref:Cullin family profile domain-containing protein n=1 Tax=Kuraishia capsulata CBS 1993 TaxID=1382522 RepID=W6ML50_9ASCO|nr:uncharacterized protein KUCA_T00003187001 [Kuraishia capsulata CBS 1993]CDK27209.1 unnamed protein product [Kuraishia capsulata CBS 1993]
MISSATGARKARIRPPRKLTSTQSDFQKSWEVLSSAIKEIQEKRASNLSFEELYRRAYNAVLRKHGKQLYENIKAVLSEHLENAVYQKLSLLKGEQGASLLKAVNSEWNDFLLCMRMISDVFMYLDRVYTKESFLPPVYNMGLNLFRDKILKNNNHAIGHRLVGIVNLELNKSRQGEFIDRYLIKSTVSMFESLEDEPRTDTEGWRGQFSENYYSVVCEPALMDSSRVYFERLAQELLSEKNGSLYLSKANQLMREEEKRLILYLPEDTYPKLCEMMMNALISTNLETVMGFENGGLRSWISENDYNSLSLLYTLSGSADANYGTLRFSLKEMIISATPELDEKATEFVAELQAKSTIPAKPQQKKKPGSLKESSTQYAIKWIGSLIELKDKYDIMLDASFERNVLISKTVDSAFSELVNLNPKVAEYLSLFVDDGIRKSFKEKSHDEYESILDKSIVIFRFIKDKDLVEKYYKNHLAKRLLQQKSFSSDIERSMISKLKKEVGYSFTSKLEVMFRDVKISRDTSAEFASKLAASEQLVADYPFLRKLELEINVLTGTFWPMTVNKNLDVNFPLELSLLREQFEKYYGEKHAGRKLIWAPNSGTVDMRIRFPKKTYEVNMPVYSAIIILLLFSEDDQKQYTFEEIRDITNIPENDLVRQLQSIAVASRSRLLTKTPMTKDIHPGDVFSVNEKFRSPMTKIKVLTVSSSTKLEDDQERSHTMKSVDADRKIEVDAAVVRIMKARKTLKHNDLLGEIIKQLSNRFKPSPSLMKQRIESLIDNEYLERDEEDRTVYHYLA